MRYYKDAEIWRRTVEFRGEVSHVCDRLCWDDWLVEEWMRSCNMMCLSVRAVFKFLDEESVLDGLSMARGKMFRLSSLVATCFDVEGLDSHTADKMHKNLREMVGMVDCLITEVEDGFWWEGAGE